MHARSGTGPESGARWEAAAVRVPHDGRRASTGGLSARLVALQRAAGNAATCTLLRAGGHDARPFVQRQPKAPPVKVDKKAEAAAALKKLRDTYSYAYWLLAEGKGVQPNASGEVTLMVNGVRVKILPDRLLTEAEFKAQGGSFEVDGHLFAAVTSHDFGGVTWDPKSLKTTRMGDSFVVDDYTEPVAEVTLRTTYRKISAKRTLAQARGVNSGYGKGRTLQDHEASHSADAIAYIRANGPRLADGRGLDAANFNTLLGAYFDVARHLSANISAYSKASTDCPGKRNAFFCKAAPKKK